MSAALIREVAKAAFEMWDVTNCQLTRIADALETRNFQGER